MLHHVWASQVVENWARAPPGGHSQKQLLHPLLQHVQRLSPKHHQHHPLCAVVAPAHAARVCIEHAAVFRTTCECCSRPLSPHNVRWQGW